MPQYYQLAIGADEKAWHLDIQDVFADGSPVDIWAYRGCRRLRDPKPVPFAIQVDGDRIDYYDSASCTTVVSRRLAELWERLAGDEIQRIPALVEGDSGEWEVINIVRCIDCIDHTRSKITYYPDNHPKTPGKPRGVLRLVLDADRIGHHHIFHPTDWEVVTVVSELMKRAMEDMGATGIDYWPVTE